MVKKNNIFESLNLFNNSKSGKKSYNGILIIAGILGVMFLIGVIAAAGIWVDNAGTLNQSAVRLYANLSKGGLNASTIENLNWRSYNLTIMEGTPETIAINFSAMSTTADAAGNVSQINITFDQSFTISLLHQNGSVPIVEHNVTISQANSAPGSNVTGTQANFSVTTSNGKRYSWLNVTGLITNESTTNATFWFNITGAVPGTYNITVLLANNSLTAANNESNATRFVVKINDTTVPHFMNFFANSTGVSSVTQIYSDVAIPATTTKVNLSSKSAAVTLYASVNVTDFNETGAGGIGYAGQNVIKAFFYFYNDTGIMNTSNISGADIRKSFGLNLTGHTGLVSNLTDGNYMIVVRNFTDVGGNKNTTAIAYNVTIDGTNPSVTVAKASSSTSKQIVLDLTLSDATSGINGKQCTTTGGGTESITQSGTTGTQTATQTGLSCSSDYTYTVACTDHAGNTNSQSVTVKTDACSGGSSSGTGGTGGSGDVVGSANSAFWILTYNEASIDLSEDSDGVSSLLNERYRVKVMIDTKLYYVGVVETTDTTAKINVTTTAEDKEVTFNIGDVSKFDVNADNKYDISVTLNGIDSATGKADLSLVYIQEEVPAEEQVPVEEGVGEGAPTTAKSKAWIWILVVVLAVLIIWAILAKKKSRMKNYGF